MKVRSEKLAVLLALFVIALMGATIAQAQTEIRGTLQVNVDASISPHKLPRESRAPVAVSIGWHVSTTDGSQPPQLKKLKIEINRNGILDPTGLPVCPYNKIQPASTSRALKNCRSSLVGKGSFAAIVGIEGQESYVAKGKMVVFNSEKGGKPVLFGQIYSAYPFANSFVITFKVNKPKKGNYGTSLTAVLPHTLLAWGNLTEIQMRLSRKYAFNGEWRSFLTATCPTPKGIGIASFNLARTSFAFVGGQQVSSTLSDDCTVRR
jgi:hypothetical protein